MNLGKHATWKEETNAASSVAPGRLAPIAIRWRPTMNALWPAKQAIPQRPWYGSGRGPQGIARHGPPYPAALHLDRPALRQDAPLRNCLWRSALLAEATSRLCRGGAQMLNHFGPEVRTQSRPVNVQIACQKIDELTQKPSRVAGLDAPRDLWRHRRQKQSEAAQAENLLKWTQKP